MQLPNDALHDLANAATRLTAIVSLLSDAETRASLEPAQLHRDVLATLEKFRETWTAHYERK